MSEQKPVATIKVYKLDDGRYIVAEGAELLPHNTELFTTDQLKAERENAITEAARRVKRHMLMNAGYTMTDIQCCILALLSTNESKENEVNE